MQLQCCNSFNLMVYLTWWLRGATVSATAAFVNSVPPLSAGRRGIGGQSGVPTGGPLGSSSPAAGSLRARASALRPSAPSPDPHTARPQDLFPSPPESPTSGAAPSLLHAAPVHCSFRSDHMYDAACVIRKGQQLQDRTATLLRKWDCSSPCICDCSRGSLQPSLLPCIRPWHVIQAKYLASKTGELPCESGVSLHSDTFHRCDAECVPACGAQHYKICFIS